jgi:molybdenum cofactor cytidylyltransferase
VTISTTFNCQGILLAAGKGRRFDPQGECNKLLQRIPSGECIVEKSARTLCSILPTSLAVIGVHSTDLALVLEHCDMQSIVCPDAGSGLAHSLTYALRHTAHSADAWIIALADMPYVQRSTIEKLQHALLDGAEIVVPTFAQRRGNPVGFSRRYLPELLQLTGDQGARQLLTAYPVTEVAVDDDGIFRDIDTPSDLH